MARKQTTPEQRARNRERATAWRKAHPGYEKGRSRERNPAKDRARYLANRAQILRQKKEYWASTREQRRAYCKEHYAANRERLLEEKKEYLRENRERIQATKKEHYAANQTRLLEEKRESYSKNPEKMVLRSQKYKSQHREQTNTNGRKNYMQNSEGPNLRINLLVTKAKRRAKNRGLLFDEALRPLLTANPPTKCACCHNALEYATRTHAQARSASLDRVNSSEGYTVANVCVICWRCNSLKNNATMAEVKAILTYMEAHQTPSP